MKVTCSNCEEIVEKYLCDIPHSWRVQISKVLCETITQDFTMGCPEVQECETLTTLSNFTVNGSLITIS